MRWALAAVVAFAGCYNPNAKTGVPCAPNGACPDGQQCDTTQSPPVCVVMPGSGGSGDGGMVPDAAPDAAGPTCLDNSMCTGATAPICDPTSHTCRGCTADAECVFVPGVCVEYTGACVADANAIFLSPAPAGVDAGTCTRAAPCATFAYALMQVTATARTIRVGDGSYTEAIDVPSTVGAGQVVISGEDSDPTTPSITATVNPIFTFDNTTTVLLEGVTATSGPSDGVRINGGSATLSHVVINANALAGVNSPGSATSAVTIVDSQILGNTLSGVFSMQTVIDLERTVVRGNLNGGVHTRNGPITIINCIIAKNGGPTTTTGGVRMDNFTPGGSIQYDTIAYNTAGGTTNSPGIQCGQLVTITNMILADNGPAGTAQYSGGIGVSHSLFEGGPTPQGMGNKTGNPSFKDIANGDFHIMAGSMAIDQAAGTNVDIDLDGEHRPNGAGPDMGADELYP